MWRKKGVQVAAACRHSWFLMQEAQMVVQVPLLLLPPAAITAARTAAPSPQGLQPRPLPTHTSAAAAGGAGGGFRPEHATATRPTDPQAKRNTPPPGEVRASGGQAEDV